MSIDSTTTQKEGKALSSTRTRNSRGHTIVKSKALVRVANQVAADTLGVSADNVKVSIHDDGARLGFSIESPLSEADVKRCSLRKETTIFSLCESARQQISQRAAHITGHNIGEINVVIAGVEKKSHDEGRVQ